MGIRITTLCENTAGQPGILAEWGWSVFLEDDSQSILFDTGSNVSVVYNADRLGVDLRKVEKIVLSHGHFDHTGGLRLLLGKMKREIEVIAHPDIWEPKYSRRKGKTDRYIGIPFQQRELESLGAKFMLSTEPVKLTDNIMTTGEIPPVTDFEKIEPHFFVHTGGGWEPDRFRDDLSLVITTRLGLVVILGCAHRGMINTLYRARSITGNRKVHMVLGGCHLMEASDERIWHTISALNEIGVQKMGVSHCTGMHAMLLLAQTYGDDFIFNSTGTIINLA